MKKMILSAVMLVFAASGRAQEAGAASPTEHNEWLTTFEAVADLGVGTREYELIEL